MAELLDISIKHYSEVERGITGLSVDKLIYLSNLLGISLDYLLKGTTDNDTLPLPLIEAYQSCPDDKKDSFLEFLKAVKKLME